MEHHLVPCAMYISCPADLAVSTWPITFCYCCRCCDFEFYSRKKRKIEISVRILKPLGILLWETMMTRQPRQRQFLQSGVLTWFETDIILRKPGIFLFVTGRALIKCKIFSFFILIKEEYWFWNFWFNLYHCHHP